MFFSLWRGLWKGKPVLTRGSRPSCLPRLEALEDRMVPALGGSAVFSFAGVPAAVSALASAGSKPSGGTTPLTVTVPENSSETVINLGAAFATVPGLQHRDGLKLSILGNTNRGLVSTDLSEAALTLTYTRGKSGTATITLCATDADGVSVKRTLVVRVRPVILAGAGARLPTSTGQSAPGGAGTSR
jgi:hypothetical protein